MFKRDYFNIHYISLCSPYHFKKIKPPAIPIRYFKTKPLANHFNLLEKMLKNGLKEFDMTKEITLYCNIPETQTPQSYLLNSDILSELLSYWYPSIKVKFYHDKLYQLVDDSTHDIDAAHKIIGAIELSEETNSRLNAAVFMAVGEARERTPSIYFFPNLEDLIKNLISSKSELVINTLSHPYPFTYENLRRIHQHLETIVLCLRQNKNIRFSESFKRASSKAWQSQHIAATHTVQQWIQVLFTPIKSAQSIDILIDRNDHYYLIKRGKSC